MIVSPLALLTPTLVMSFFGFDLFLAEARTNTKGCVDPSEFSDSYDFFPEKIERQHSKNWDMTYHETYKILYNNVVNETYLMYQCGTTPPESEVAKHNAVFAVPLQGGLAISSTTQLVQLEQLGLRRQIKAYVGESSWVSSPCLQTLISEGITDSVSNATAYLEDNSGHVTLYGSSPSPPHENSIIISEAAEGENRAIFEWHKVYGSLFNLEKEANDQFEASSSRFECGAANAEYISTTVLEEKEKPTVLWGYFSSYEWAGVKYESWSVATCDPKYNYYCEYADQCFSNLLHSNVSMNFTQFVEFGKTADVWIYSGFNWDEMYEEYGAELQSFPSVQKEAVYDLLGSGSGPWFEQRIAEYDLVQQDFCDAVGHTDTVSQHKRRYLRKVLPQGVEDVGSLGDCDISEIDVQWESRASECVYMDTNSDPSHNASDSHDHEGDSHDNDLSSDASDSPDDSSVLEDKNTDASDSHDNHDSHDHNSSDDSSAFGSSTSGIALLMCTLLITLTY